MAEQQAYRAPSPYVQIPSAWIRNMDIPHERLRLLLIVDAHADHDTGISAAKVETYAEEWGCCRQTMAKRLREAVEDGHLHVVNVQVGADGKRQRRDRGQWSRNHYRVAWREPVAVLTKPTKNQHGRVNNQPDFQHDRVNETPCSVNTSSPSPPPPSPVTTPDANEKLSLLREVLSEEEAAGAMKWPEIIKASTSYLNEKIELTTVAATERKPGFLRSALRENWHAAGEQATAIKANRAAAIPEEVKSIVRPIASPCQVDETRRTTDQRRKCMVAEIKDAAVQADVAIPGDLETLSSRELDHLLTKLREKLREAQERDGP